jgi:SPX domain protein involved in polyphosphate accumulation
MRLMASKSHPELNLAGLAKILKKYDKRTGRLLLEICPRGNNKVVIIISLCL